MRKLPIITMLIFVALNANAQVKKTIDLSFMLGRWEMKTAKGKITENWLKTKEGLVGKSYRHGLKGDSVLTESVVVKMIKTSLYFCVTGMEKNNAGTTNFQLISVDNDTYIFENKLHDYPQRIVYQNKGKNSLLAWIEGTVNGKYNKSEFPYIRRR